MHQPQSRYLARLGRFYQNEGIMDIKKGDYIYFVYPRKRIGPPMKYLGGDSYLTADREIVVRKQSKIARKISVHPLDAILLPYIPALRVLWWILIGSSKVYMYKWGMIVGYSPIESYLLTRDYK